MCIYNVLNVQYSENSTKEICLKDTFRGHQIDLW